MPAPFPIPTDDDAADPAADPGADSDHTPGADPEDAPLRPRQEAFCQHFVLLGDATAAARAAHYKPESCRNQGYRLLRRPEIARRIADVRRGLAAAHGLDKDVLLGKLEALYERAMSDHHFHAAARAVELQARIAGFVAGRAAVVKRRAPPLVLPAPGGAPQNDDQ